MLSLNEDFLKKIIGFLGDAGREVFNSIIRNEVEDALARERKFEIKRAIKTLYEAKVKEEVIIQLLHDYCKISEYQAREAFRVERTVNSPQKLIKTYLKSKGHKISYI